MCGIAGAYSFKHKIVEQQWLQNAATSLNKRGPDNQNFIYGRQFVGEEH